MLFLTQKIHFLVIVLFKFIRMIKSIIQLLSNSKKNQSLDTQIWIQKIILTQKFNKKKFRLSLYT
jgi:hypothetical protein